MARQSVIGIKCHGFHRTDFTGFGRTARGTFQAGGASRRRNQLAVMLQSLQHETQQLQAQEQQLKRALAKEEADVERLKKMSATAILYSILGKKEAKFDKEAQEAAAARLRYTAAGPTVGGRQVRTSRFSRSWTISETAKHNMPRCLVSFVSF